MAHASNSGPAVTGTDPPSAGARQCLSPPRGCLSPLQVPRDTLGHKSIKAAAAECGAGRQERGGLGSYESQVCFRAWGLGRDGTACQGPRFSSALQTPAVTWPHLREEAAALRLQGKPSQGRPPRPISGALPAGLHPPWSWTQPALLDSADAGPGPSSAGWVTPS